MTKLPGISLSLVAAAISLPVAAQTIQVNKENRTIAITATGKVTVMADTATIHVGFISYGPDSDAAYATGSRISNAIMKALSGSGIPADAIQSDNQSVNPVQPYQVERLTPAEKAQRQFQVTQSWTVRTAAADAARTLDLAVKSGANQSGQIDWSFKDENAPDTQAAAKALQHARTQAQEMATTLNTKLGALLYASNEVQASPIRPVMRANASLMAMDSKVQPLAINPREIEKTATVYAVFAIE